MIISSSPLHSLYMSNGPDWKSCQHFQHGDFNDYLAGNFYDLGMAVVMLIDPRTHIWDRGAVLVRTTIRVFRDQNQMVIGIGETYHNNETLAFLMLSHLAHLLDQQQLSWGFLWRTNALSYGRKGFLGADLQRRLAEVEGISVRSEPFWLPDGWYQPYIDEGNHHWEWVSQNRYCLQATLQLIQPPVVAAARAA